MRAWNRREFVQRGGAGLALAWMAGRARGLAQGGGLALGNRVLEGAWRAQPAGGLVLASVRAGGAALLGAPVPAFTLTVGGAVVDSSQLRVASAPRHTALAARPNAARLAERAPGHAIEVDLRDPEGRFQVRWRALLRDGSHYLRQEVAITAGASALPLTEVALVDFAAAGSLADIAVNGRVAGSPLTAGNWFLGFEHPLSKAAVADGRARAWFTHALPVEAGHTATYTSVLGIAAPGQMRRDFLAYVERERAHPYRPFLHYNSWFDLGYFTPYDQNGCLEVIAAFGQELHEKRGVRLDSFLFDDGWDNHDNWEFNAGFPHGFTPLKAATARYGARPGVWLSPWGGYGKPRGERLANGKKNGYEINKEGLALSGPVYYKVFHQACLRMIREYGVNQFKLDGTGSASQVVPGSAFGSDFEAAIALIDDMRAAEPDLYVNLTTGTYPSPFWLRYADSTWRGGYDTNFAGVGTDRQQWITYRDGDTYRRVVGRGPLYPLNALMLHGIVFAKHAKRLDTDPGHDFDAGVRAYFGTGTQLQEMYISHDLLDPAAWDVLAEAARWARLHAPTLVDTHWVGGDPNQLEAYGHAAWSPHGAVLTLRNPSDKPQEIALDPAQTFELPPSAGSARLSLRCPWKNDQWRQPVAAASVELEPGTAHRFALKPFEVLTLSSGT